MFGLITLLLTRDYAIGHNGNTPGRKTLTTRKHTMSATGRVGTTSYRATEDTSPEAAVAQIVFCMATMTAQAAYDQWMLQHTGIGRDFLKMVRSQLLAQGIEVEA